MTAIGRRLREVGRERFGFDELLVGQERAMRAVLKGRDTLVVMPTGAGKSAIYQIPALLLDGPTVVVSPLISLQRDQVEGLQETGIEDAAEANSTQKKSERDETFEALEQGDLQFLFLAPEQLANEETRAELCAAKPALVVVDEAHCISAWGHDFRPEYLELDDAIRELGRPPVLALTATASPLVRDEILQHLDMDDAEVVVHGFDRPNIHLAVERFADGRSKREALLDRVQEAHKPGIVYVARKKTAEELAGELWQRGVQGVYYHGGMSASERERAQAAFMDNEFEVVVATTAFGMGIDKPDVRFVFHYDIPDSLDSYYQEIGRAGRDGEPADAYLFYRSEDLGIRRFFAATGDDERQRQLEESRLAMMRSYAETFDCRRQFLLNYFGEKFETPCNYCDNCEAGTTETGNDSERPFDLNSRVAHKSWGEGMVVRYEGDKVTVLFDDAGYKTLSLQTVRERNLVEDVR